MIQRIEYILLAVVSVAALVVLVCLGLLAAQSGSPQAFGVTILVSLFAAIASTAVLIGCLFADTFSRGR